MSAGLHRWPVGSTPSPGRDPSAPSPRRRRRLQQLLHPLVIVAAIEDDDLRIGDVAHLARRRLEQMRVLIRAGDDAVDGDAVAANAAEYSKRLGETLADLGRISQRVTEIRARHAGKPIAATEPVFGLMADALGLTMRNQSFQRALMNETEPSARDIAAFESDLKTGKVKALIYNKQVSEKLAERLLTIARTAKVPVVPVTETQPANVAFHDWMLGELDALDKALTGPNS